jgi:NitT/TauT family transport system ATP-binding protein/sulfonate transport system ATP-binding protein
MTDILDKEKILKIRDVNRSFIDERTGERRQILKDINLSVFEGEFISILGASGCGKTTLLRLIAGLDPVQEGKIILDGEPVHGPDSKRGYVFQQGCLFPWLTVEDNIAMGLKIRGVYKQNKDKVRDFIEKIGLGGFEKNFPHQISGGMAQRVAIARALINDPEILLLDEPMGALDSFTRADIQNLLLELRKERNTTMILVTHDIDEALYLSDRIVIMTPRPGRISEVLEIRDSFPRERGSAQFLEKRRNILERFNLARSNTAPEYVI